MPDSNTIPFMKNTLYYGDCLEVMGQWPDRCVDLIYLDPPFNSNVNHNILYKNQRPKEGNADDLAQITAFADTWFWGPEAAKRVRDIKNAVGHPAHRSIRALDAFFSDGSGMLSYLSYMAQRLAEMPRLLKDTGSIYLHCDPTASHYLKMIMDDVFGAKNFRNEIIWTYTGSRAPDFDFARKHDTLFRYSKTKKVIFNHLFTPYAQRTIDRFDKKDKKGNYKITYRDGKEYKTYLKEGKRLESVWSIPIIMKNSNQSLGYPTQKPFALLERIVQASSNEGGVVLDPFCGCGTTIEAAHKLKRKWLGIDISFNALDVIRKERMMNIKIGVQGEPKDLLAAADLARNKPFDFEKWAVTRIPGFWPNEKQVADGGIDGRAAIYRADENGSNLCIAQVKGGVPSADSLRAFSSILAGGRYAMGVFITLNKMNHTPTIRQCIAAAGSMEIGAKKYDRMTMWSVEEYFAGVEAKLPAMAHPRTGKPYQSDILSA